MSAADFYNGVNSANFYNAIDAANSAAEINNARADAESAEASADKWYKYAKKLETEVTKKTEYATKLESEVRRLSQDKEKLWWDVAKQNSLAVGNGKLATAMHQEVIDAGLADQLRLSGDGAAMTEFRDEKKSEVMDNWVKSDINLRSNGRLDHIR